MRRPTNGAVGALGLLAVLVVAVVGGAAPAARAQASPVPTGRLRLASQTAWVGAGGDYALRIDLEQVSDATALDLAVTFHRAVTSRSELDEAAAGRPPRATVAPEHAVPLASLGFDAAGAVGLAFHLGTVAEPASGTVALPALAEGVFPVEVVLRDHTTRKVVDRLMTQLVRTPDQPVPQPLAVAWAEAVGTTAVLRPDGAHDLGDAPAQALDRLTSGLANLAFPVSLQVFGQGVDGLPTATRQAISPHLRAVATLGQLLAAPYAAVDASALVAAGLGDELAVQREHGDTVVRALVGADGDPRTWVADTPLSPAAVRRLRDLGVSRVVVPETGLRPLPSRLTNAASLANRFLLRGDGGSTVDAAVADPGLQAHFDVDDPVLGAYRLLADLAVLYNDLPGKARGVVVRPPVGWRPDAAFLQTVGANLGRAPMLHAVTLDGFFATVPAVVDARRPVVRDTVADPGTTLPGRQLSQARAAADELSALVGPASDPSTAARRLVLVAEGHLGAGVRQDYLNGVRTTAGAIAGKVHVTVERRVRLTAREGRIPLTVVNDNPFPVHVRLDLSSEKLEFTEAPAGTDRTQRTIDAIELRAAGRQTFVVRVRARTSAQFKLRATLRSAAGHVLGRSELTVTSTALSGVGVVLSVGALLFLVVWWVRHWRRTRRSPVAAG